MFAFIGFFMALFGLLALIGNLPFLRVFASKYYLGWKLPIAAVVFFGGMVLTSVFYAEPGHSYKVYYPVNYPLLGNNKIVTEPGYTFGWWGDTREFQNEIVFRYILPIDEAGTLPKDIPENIYAYSAKDHQWEFADAVKAYIGASVVLSINPKDISSFSAMVDDVKSEDQLVFGRIIPDIHTAIKNTCKLMYAQEYISGEAANFDRYFRDQLENGSYQLEPYYVYGDDEQIGDTSNTRIVTSDGSDKKGTRRWKIALDPKTKLPLRESNDKTNSLSHYHMTIRQAVSDNIDWEDRFDTRLDEQKKMVAETQLEKQGAEKALYNQKKLYAQGEALKTEERARLEKIQIEKTIEAETNAKAAAFKVIEEQNLLNASIKSSQRKRIDADADSYTNRQMVAAGLTPLEKMKLENERYIGVAKEIKELVLPSTVIMGENNKGQDGLLSQLIGAALAKQLLPPEKK